jgi:hypothetical protein
MEGACVTLQGGDKSIDMAVQKSKGKSSIQLGHSVGSTTAGFIYVGKSVNWNVLFRTGSDGGVLRTLTGVSFCSVMACRLVHIW